MLGLDGGFGAEDADKLRNVCGVQVPICQVTSHVGRGRVDCFL